MKTEEMADLLDGLVSFTERFAGKSALNDVRTLSDCMRHFPDETVAAFCGAVVKARSEKPARGRTAAAIDQAKVDAMANQVNHFLNNRREYSYAQIDELVRSISKDLKLAEIKHLGQRIECTLTSKSKPAIIKELKSWLETIKSNAEQSSFNLSGAAS